LNATQKKHLCQYLGKARLSSESHWDLIRIAQGSVARLVIIPIQDILGLGEESRMNHPSNSQNDWRWQLTSEQMSELQKKALPRLKKLSEIYGRDGKSKK
jgi:4-alpha-glucanotransferase